MHVVAPDAWIGEIMWFLPASRLTGFYDVIDGRW
jgi:hypothetical protein